MKSNHLSQLSTWGLNSSRYIRGESPDVHHQSALLAPVKEEQPDHLHHPPSSSSMHYRMTDSDLGSTFLESSAGELLPDVDHQRFAMAIRRRGSSGLLNLTAASEADLRRAAGGHHGVPEHELRSAGVYLTLTNNWEYISSQLTSSRKPSKKIISTPTCDCSFLDVSVTMPAWRSTSVVVISSN